MQLILNTFGASLRRKDGMFHVLSGEKDVTVSPRKVQSICATTGVHLSTDALRLAIEHHIDVLLINSAKRGLFCARPKQGYRASHRCAADQFAWGAVRTVLAWPTRLDHRAAATAT